MIAGTVDYGAVGSFSWDDNGLIYDARASDGRQHPFRFTASARPRPTTISSRFA